MIELATISALIGGIFKPACELVDDIVTSDEERLQLKAKLLSLENEVVLKAMDVVTKLIDAQKEIILAEAKGSWMQRNWRPLLMLGLVAIIFNNYIIMPYAQAMFDWSVVLELPDKLWNLLTVGVGGYVVGRSAEKVSEKWKGGL